MALWTQTAVLAPDLIATAPRGRFHFVPGFDASLTSSTRTRRMNGLCVARVHSHAEGTPQAGWAVPMMQRPVESTWVTRLV